MRAVIAFPCAGEALVATLDTPDGRAVTGGTGLLIVSGGNEIRIGAHRGMAALARRIAAAGHPVLRYDRRGIGDSSGANGGFEASGPDIAAAAAALRATPGVGRVVAFGNCDAASALALFHRAAGIDALVLANPWTVEEAGGNDGADALPPPAAIRARYAAKLKDPREVWRLVSGGVDITKLVRGLRRSRQAAATGLAERIDRGLAGTLVTILIARGDNTAIAFRAALPGRPVIERDTDSHSFSAPGDADWLFERIVEKLA